MHSQISEHTINNYINNDNAEGRRIQKMAYKINDINLYLHLWP